MKKLKLIGSSLIIGFLLVVCLPLLSMSQTWGPKYTSITSNTGGYYEYLPQGYYDAANAGKKWPVILFIHGIGETGSGTGAVLTNITGVGLPYLITQGYFPKTFTVGGQTHSFIVIAPQFKSWPSNADVEACLNYIAANYNTDLNRMYLTGLSMGGGVVWDYASSNTAASGRLAAIVPICGASSPSTSKCQNMASTNLPVLATHNADDGVVGVGSTNGYVDGINAFNPNPRAAKVIWPSGGHNAWSATYDPSNKLVGGTMNTYEWMLQYSRGVAVPPPPPSSLVISFSGVTMVTCNGGANGRATASTTGGTAPYTYSWSTSPVQTTATASNLRAGTYSVTVRDANNNTTTSSVTISEPPRLTINVSAGSIATYGGTTNVSLSASGGTGTYTFSGGPTTNVAAGTYTYTVTDANGCTDSRTVTITQPALPSVSASMTSNIPVSCAGGANGSLTVTASGGLAPYTYNWNTSPEQTTATASGLRAGNYSVTVRDANGNFVIVNATVTQPSALALTVSPGVISSYGGTTTVALSATGGTAPYSYAGPVTNVSAGTYTYTVTDARGCSDSKTITISQPAAPPSTLNLTLNGTAVSCNGGATGSASVSVSGGLSPYTYSWSTSPVQTGSTASNLRAGTYTVTVRDANNVSSSGTVTITEPAALVLNVAPGTIDVYGGQTNVFLSASGGTAPYSYTGQTMNLNAGTFSYSVTDAAGCTDSKTITITQPAPPTPPAPPASVGVNVTGVNMVSCFGGANGSATATATGGTAPFTYSWNTSPVQTGAVATNLRAGTYTVTVRDANNLTATATATITEPVALSLHVSPGTIDVYGGQTSVVLGATGGTQPYTFAGQTTNLNAGTFTYSVTDARGCTDSKTITITQPAPPPPTPVSVTIVGVKMVDCYAGSNGNATASAFGGTAPYTYSWNTAPVQTTAIANNLLAGVYTVTVKDANNNQVTATVTITEPQALVLSANAGVISSYGGTTTVSLSATGGSAPYSYSGPVTNVAAGTYTYSVTDAKGCTGSNTITINQPAPPPPPPAPAPLVVSVSGTSVNCFGGSNGSATVTASGGTSPYTYSWSSSPAHTSATATDLRAGTYTVTVKDANNLSASGTVTITEPAALVLNVNAGTIDTYGGQTNVVLGASGGTAPYSYAGPTTNLVAGTYSYSVTDAKGCADNKTITLTQPEAPAPPTAPGLAAPALSAVVSKVDKVTCNGGKNGSASITISGGATPYKLVWSHDAGLNATTATGLGAGRYGVDVIDANNNKVSLQIDITEPQPLSLSIDSVSAGLNLWNIQLSANGGVAPYQFNGKTSAVTPGTYTYSVVDANGCSLSRNLQFNEAPALAALTLNIQAGQIKCNGGTTSVQLKATGGVQPYRYIGDTLNVAAGTFNYSVVDAAGNQLTKQITISQPDPLALGITAEPVKRIGGKTDVVLQATGGTAPYAYTGETQNLKAGKYQFSVIDQNQCSASGSIDIKQPGIVVSKFEAIPVDTAITLNWVTSYEHEIDYFEVERSVDNVNFTLFMKVKSNWNNLVLPKYNVVDNTPQLRRNYYRVYAVTIFGEKIPIKEEDIFYENRGRVDVRNMVDMLDVTVMNPYQEELELTLMDINGRPLSRQKVKKENFTWNSKVSMKNLNSGVYVLKISGQHVQFAKQVVKL